VAACGYVISTWTTERGVHELAVRGGRGSVHPLVRRYVGYRERADELCRRHVANAGVCLILAFGDPVRVGYADEPWATFGAFVVGSHTRPALTAFAGHQHGVQVDLTPEGACALLGGSLRHLTDRAVPVEEVLGRGGAEVVARLADSRSWARRFAVLDHVIGVQQSQARLDPDVRWVWQQLIVSHGKARIEPLVVEIGWSRRHFTRKFEQQIGLQPKAVARLARFEYALELMRRTGDDPSLATVAANAGYFDQAHFNRDFRAFSGCTPTQHLAESEGDPQVQFVQDDHQDRAIASAP
jgi:AraC-like DNA-binding protein